MSDLNANYKTVRIKKYTYKKMKQLALDKGIPMTKLFDEMLDLLLK